MEAHIKAGLPCKYRLVYWQEQGVYEHYRFEEGFGWLSMNRWDFEDLAPHEYQYNVLVDADARKNNDGLYGPVIKL